MGLLSNAAKAARNIVAGEPFGGLIGVDSGKEPWWTDSWESTVKRLRQRVVTVRPKFCIHCGSFIEDPDIRQMHVKMDHHGAKTSDCEFCIFCGDHIGPNGERRVEHYNKNHSQVKARENAS